MRKIGAFEAMWAVYFIVLLLLWMIFEKAMGLHDVNIDKHESMSMFFALIAIGTYVFYMKAKRKQLGDDVNYMDLLFGGIAFSIGVAILTPLAQYIISEFITPDYFQNAINYTVENNKKTLEDAQAYFNLKNYIFQSTLFSLGMGIVTSAIVAIFFRKKIKVEN